MTPLDQARLFLAKAAQDEALLDAVLDDETVSVEIFGFHCQQAVEKLLKAWLTSRSVHTTKTHNLEALVEKLEAEGLAIAGQLPDLNAFTAYATVYRYEELPEYVALDRKAARALVAQVRAIVEARVNAPPP